MLHFVKKKNSISSLVLQECNYIFSSPLFIKYDSYKEKSYIILLV